MFTSTNLPTAVVALLLLASSTSADTINVPGDYPTITAAVANASNGDTILVQAGTYREGPINFGGKNLDITSSAGPELTTITLADGASGSVVRIRGGQDAASLSGFKITGGDGTNGQGGGMEILGSSKGPGMFTEILVEDCIITGNTADSLGAGIYADENVVLTINRCTFRANFTMGSGGGAYLDCGEGARVFACRFEGNYAGSKAGGLKIGGLSSFGKESLFIVESSIFTGNIAGVIGGGLAAEPSEFIPVSYCGAINCTFSGNVAPIDPAVTSIPTSSLDPARVENSILSNNIGSQQILGIAVESEFFTPTQFQNCMIDTISAGEESSEYNLIGGIAAFANEYGTDGLSGTGDEDLRLTPLSAAIDQGAEPTDVSISTTDVYGDARRVDDPLVPPSGNPGPLDLGAAEFDIQTIVGSLAIWQQPGQENLEFLQNAQWFGGLLPLDGPLGLVRIPGSISGAFVDGFEEVGDIIFDGGRMTIEASVSGAGLHFRAGGPYRGLVKVVERPGETTALYATDMIFRASDLMLEGGATFFRGTDVQIFNGAIDVDPGAELSFLYGSTISSVGVQDAALQNNGILTAREMFLEGTYAQAALDTVETIVQPGTLIATIEADDDSTSIPDLNVSEEATLGGTLAVTSRIGQSPPSGTTIPVLSAETITDTFELLFAQGFPDTVALALDISQSFAGGSSEAIVEILATSDTTFGEIDFESIWPDGIEDALLVDVDNDGDDDLVVALTVAPGETFSYVGVLKNFGSSGGIWSGFDTFQVGFNSVKISGSTDGLAAGDLDSDGLVDLVVANRASGTLHVLQNGSTPTQIQFFDVLSEDSAPDLTPGTGQPTSVWIGDLDLDGRPDVAVNNETDGSVVTFQNVSSLALSLGPGSSSNPLKKIRRISPTGTGTAREEKPFGPGKNEGNSNGSESEGGSDDDDDDASAGNVQVGSTAAATLQGMPRLEWNELTVGAEPVDAQAGDLDGNGFRDIVTANRAGESVSIIFASGLDTYDPALTIPIGTECSAVHLGDFDGDNDLDIAILVGESASTSNSVRILRNDTDLSGMPSFSLEGDSLFAGSGVKKVLVGRLNTDANADIVVLAVSPTLEFGVSDPGWMATLTATGSSCTGDVDSDGIVGPIDLAVLLGSWGAAKTSDPADFDNDGIVGPIDLAILLGAWGNCGGTVD